MGFLGSFEDFLYVPGQSGASFVKKALSEASNFACQLYKDHPGIANPFDTFGFGRGVWDELCRPRPPGLPSPPAQPYTGGQCDCVSYTVRVNFTNLSGGSYFTSIPVWGPVTAVVDYVDKGALGNDQYEGIAVHCRGSAGSPCGSPTVIKRELSSGSPYGSKILGVVITRNDGLPDNCGNVNPGYPDEVLPEADRSADITVNNDDGTSVTLPVVVLFPTANVDFNLNVPIAFDLGGLHFHLNLDGFHSGKPGGTSPPDAKKDAKDIKDRLDDIANPPNPDEDPRLTPAYPPAADSGEEDELSGAKWIKIDLTTLPDKAQYSRSGRTVYFAGWLEFHKEGYALPRMQINYQKSIFRFPDGADGYGYTFTNGAAGTVTVYTEEEEEDG